MKQALFCKTCEVRLTNWLSEIDDVESMNRLCDLPCGGPLEEDNYPIPQGYVLRVAGDVLAFFRNLSPGWNPEGLAQDWMNLNDLMPIVEYTRDVTKLNGCCGLDGCDGPNRICICGVDVGTETSDCWNSHMFTAYATNTHWKTK